MRPNHHIYVAAYHGPHQPTGPARCVSPVGYFVWPHMNRAGNSVVYWGRGATEAGFNIWRASVDGNRLEKLTHDRALTGAPYWRPDGQEIVFVSSLGLSAEVNWAMANRVDLETTPQNIFVMDPNGTNRRQITHGRFGDSRPSYAPDGKGIVFVSNRGGKGTANLWHCEIRTGKLTRITSHRLTDWRPMYSPDGRRLCFFTLTDPAGPHELAILDLSSGQIEYPIDPARFVWVHGPFWLPDASGIVMHALAKDTGLVGLWHLHLTSGEVSRLVVPGLKTGGHVTLSAAMDVLSFDSENVPAEASLAGC